MTVERALADTSLFIGVEQKRIDTVDFALAISVITIGELQAGVLAAADTGTRAIRLRTLNDARALEPIQIDQRVADTWAELRVALRDAGRRMPVNDSWIAATAIAHSLPLATQDDDYDSVPGLRVVRV